MYVVQLIGRFADSVVDMPYHVAQSNIASGTCRQATESEILSAGIEIAVQAPPLTADSAFPVGYRVEPTEFGGYDLFEPGGVRLNTQPYANLADARSAAVRAVEIHVAPFVPVEDALTEEVIQSQLAQRPTRTYSTADYTAQQDENGLFNVYDPGGIKLTETALDSIDEAKAFAAEHLRIMTEQGEVPGPDGDLPREDDEVVIPADWESLHHMKIRALARLILNEEPADFESAKAAIADYVKRKAA